MTPVWLAIALYELQNSSVPTGRFAQKLRNAADESSMLRQANKSSLSSAFLCWCFEQVNQPSAESILAGTWANWGEELDSPVRGCIVVHSLDSYEGEMREVGLCLGGDPNTLQLLGVDKNRKAFVYSVLRKSVFALRWPSAMAWPSRSKFMSMIETQ